MMHRMCLTPTLLTMALGAIAGYGAAVMEWRSPTLAAATEQADAVSATEVEASRTRGLSSADQLALAGHNQLVAASLAQSGKKPNILVIWGDDIGTWNISHNNRGMMGYMTP